MKMLTYEIFMEYKTIFAKSCGSIEKIVSFKEPRLFEQFVSIISSRPLKDNKTGYKGFLNKIYLELIYKGKEEDIPRLDIVLKYYKLSDATQMLYSCEKMKTMNICMLKHIYTLRKPSIRVLESTIDISVEAKRNDIFKYLIGITPYETNIIDHICYRKDLDLELIKIYGEYRPLRTEIRNCSNIWKNAIKHNRMDIVVWLYNNKYPYDIHNQYSGDKNETYEWLLKKEQDKCSIM